VVGLWSGLVGCKMLQADSGQAAPPAPPPVEFVAVPGAPSFTPVEFNFVIIRVRGETAPGEPHVKLGELVVRPMPGGAPLTENELVGALIDEGRRRGGNLMSVTACDAFGCRASLYRTGKEAEPHAKAGASEPANASSAALPRVPTRVVVDADTSLISPDPGNRVIDAIAANQSALDACLTDAAKVLEAGAMARMHIDVDTNGKLTALELERGRAVIEGDNLSGCMRNVLEKVDFGPSEFRRSGILFLKGDPPAVTDAVTDADVATITKTEHDLELALAARRVGRDDGDFDLALVVTVTNKGNAPRGVRTVLNTNEVARHDAEGDQHHSAVLQTDTTLPITCLPPGKSIRVELATSRPELRVARGGRRHSEPFLVVGDCDVAASRVMLAGVRLDWTKDTPKPTVAAVPFWAHQLDPFEERKKWRSPSGGGAK